MQYITTTQLRTKSKELIGAIRRGKRVDLIHRSEPIATIEPKSTKVKKFDAREFKVLVDKLNLPLLTDKEIEKRYRKAMMEKHGKALL
ncbi:hypothetical protein HY045_00225 [Candidatus Woesebacteria bacterium]|nr:hypothetical protein [Candidatus Woesebacteria bacterium]